MTTKGAFTKNLFTFLSLTNCLMFLDRPGKNLICKICENNSTPSQRTKTFFKNLQENFLGTLIRSLYRKKY